MRGSHRRKDQNPTATGLWGPKRRALDLAFLQSRPPRPLRAASARSITMELLVGAPALSMKCLWGGGERAQLTNLLLPPPKHNKSTLCYCVQCAHAQGKSDKHFHFSVCFPDNNILWRDLDCGARTLSRWTAYAEQMSTLLAQIRAKRGKLTPTETVVRRTLRLHGHRGVRHVCARRRLRQTRRRRLPRPRQTSCGETQDLKVAVAYNGARRRPARNRRLPRSEGCVDQLGKGIIPDESFDITSAAFLLRTWR